MEFITKALLFELRAQAATSLGLSGLLFYKSGCFLIKETNPIGFWEKTKTIVRASLNSKWAALYFFFSPVSAIISVLLPISTCFFIVNSIFYLNLGYLPSIYIVFRIYFNVQLIRAVDSFITVSRT